LHIGVVHVRIQRGYGGIDRAVIRKHGRFALVSVC
jgi:hypothetical protein